MVEARYYGMSLFLPLHLGETRTNSFLEVRDKELESEQDHKRNGDRAQPKRVQGRPSKTAREEKI